MKYIKEPEVSQQQIVESAVDELNALFNEGYYDKMGEYEESGIRGYIPNTREKIVGIVDEFIDTLVTSGFYPKEAALKEARDMLGEIVKRLG